MAVLTLLAALAIFLPLGVASRSSSIRWTIGDDAPGCVRIADAGERALCSLKTALQAIRSGGEEGGAADEKPAPLFPEKNLCTYRAEQGFSLHRYAAEAGTDLQDVLRGYARMHSYCTMLERERLREFLVRKKQPHCKYVVWSCTFGLGNKLMSLTSAFLYAVLSQRVLLVDHPGWEGLFCEPFPGSKWQVPSGFSLREDFDSPSFARYRALNCGVGGHGQDRACRSNVVEVVFSSDSSATDYTFQVCPTEMARVREVPFLNFRNSNQHFGVGYYLNPAVRPLLERLFPERNMFHLLSRWLLLPSNDVWERVTKFHEDYLTNALRRIGVQIREFKGEYHGYYDQAALLCIQAKSGLCPIEVEAALERAGNGVDPASISNSSDYVSVFVSSLENRHFSILEGNLAKLQNETGMRYFLFSQKGDGEQLDDISHLKKALVDMWVLSLSDVLLTSHMSTFGYFAHGMAGVTPYQLKHWADNPCLLGVSSEPCFHFGPQKVVCEADRFRVENPFKEVGFLKRCPDMPKTGIQVAGVYS